MSRRMRDVRCTECAALELDTFSDDDHKCVTCGAPTTTYFASMAEGMRERRADNFSPITFGGVRYETAGDWNKCRADWKHNNHEELNVTGDTRRASLARLEEANHNALTLSRSRGNHRDAAMIERSGGRIR